ncbi:MULTISPECIES: AraC family transcriptional regulator [unclassified Arcicella]|nr:MULTISPECIES: AraC family transcriptional regulator [unclassified Arcicella]MDR6564382.1 AraC-like DNA-binding protein [Arcicella sp. BE51]MDR6814131.1 AraC-like DNA-binding protein [Arcicella sp. BE140]MDR6825443.1 AraC-like DNA-binding protein [Arcicella sp. BE139]
MNHLKKGEFYGQTNQTIHLDGLTLTDTVYTQPKVDWHYHENAYFTFILAGDVIEGNKKEVYHCPAGTLLFHHWQDAHYNIKPEGFTRGFHVEIEKSWFDELLLKGDNIQGNVNLSDPALKLLMYKIFTETKIQDPTSPLSIQGLLLDVLSQMAEGHQSLLHKNPSWVATINEILNDQFADNLTLGFLSETLNIHPVHLSRDFSKYFHCTFGEYIRKLKVQKSLSLLSDKRKQLTDIAFECGFADQSHFIRCFKQINGMNPSAYRKILFS